jgi:hypothetical protein
MNIPFGLPTLAGYSDTPIWYGQAFISGEQSTPVLEYSENFAG